jgi:hypothetical protein
MIRMNENATIAMPINFDLAPLEIAHYKGNLCCNKALRP